MSEAGMVTTSRTPGTARAASVSAWANVNCASKDAGREAIDPVELAGVGDPLVDQDEARGVRFEELDERRARTRPSSVGFGNGVIGIPATELPCELAPDRVDLRAIRFLVDLTGASIWPDQHRTLGLDRPNAHLLEDRLHARKLRRRRATRQVVERDQRVRLAAAEVGLQLDDRIAALAAQPASALTSNSRRPSVRKVRRKNCWGLPYSSLASPRHT